MDKSKAQSFFEQLQTEELLENLYFPSKTSEAKVKEFTELLGSSLKFSIFRFIEFIKELSFLNKLQKAAAFAFFIKVTKQQNVWLDANIVIHITESGSFKDSQLLTTIAKAHAQIVLERGIGSKAVLGVCNLAIARYFEVQNPKLALSHAISALENGELNAFSSIPRALAVLEVDEQRPKSLSQIRKLKRRFSIEEEAQLASASISELSIDAQLVYPEKVVEVKKPEFEQGLQHYIFNGNSIRQHEVNVYRLEDATISMDMSKKGIPEFYIFDKNQVCIEELSVGFKPFVLDEAIELDGTFAMLDDKYCTTMNICHFLIDKVTRMQIFEQVAGEDFIGISCDNYDYYRTFWELVGLKDRVYLTESGRFTAKIKNLLVSSNNHETFLHPMHGGASWAANYFKKLVGNLDLKQAHRTPKRIFITRGDAKGRKILNFADVRPILEDAGFECYDLAKLSVREQVELFSSATVIAGVHGAGLTNMVFAPENCKILEILPAFVATRAYWVVSNSLNLEYHQIVAEDPDDNRPDYKTWRHNPLHNPRNIIIPLESLQNKLNSML